jgi:hypothetical protein
MSKALRLTSHIYSGHHRPQISSIPAHEYFHVSSAAESQRRRHSRQTAYTIARFGEKVYVSIRTIHIGTMFVRPMSFPSQIVSQAYI